MTENSKVRVLLVDDETDFTEPIAFWLKSRGYDVDTAVNGEEAIQRVRGGRPDIVFLDINMPVMDGLECLRQLREFDRELPVVMVTAAFGSPDKITRAKELGVSGFFAKNYTFDQLIQMIQVTLRTHRGLKPGRDGLPPTADQG
ncbi:MAG: response regulator [Deltaproteobacteria bacterium]